MEKQAPSPALDARQLVETIDTIGLLVASLSDRVDAQGRILDKVHQTATEARAAAFAAQKATDWERNAASISESLKQALTTPMARLREADGLLRKSEQLTKETTTLLETARLREAQHRVERQCIWKRRMPWLLVGAVLAGIVLTLLGVHFLSYWYPACRLVGGRFSTANEDGVSGCFFPEW